MAAGYPVTATDINNHAGSLVSALWQDLEAVRRFKRWLDDSAHNDSYLTYFFTAKNLSGIYYTG